MINLSSVFGLFSVPSQSAYNAAKFAVRGFTDALRMELEVAGNGVSATTIHPGGIKTNIARNARMDPEVAELNGGRGEIAKQFDKMAMTSPQKAARQILAAVAGRQAPSPDRPRRQGPRPVGPPPCRRRATSVMLIAGARRRTLTLMARRTASVWR